MVGDVIGWPVHCRVVEKLKTRERGSVGHNISFKVHFLGYI